MKLLLTSSGLSKRAIGEKLQQMVGKAPSDCKVGFIPTAANVELYNKDWLIAQFGQLQRYGFYQIDIVDIAADGVDWRARLDDVDVLWLSGGNTFYLLDQMRKTEFGTWLAEHAKDKVYVGGSASTIVVTPTINIAKGVDENTVQLTDLTGLQLVDFEVNVHCDENAFESTRVYAESSTHDVYALDDLSAIAVENGRIEVVSSGTWRLYEKQ
ncbi:MAG: Type 1 glutamine amidotransferase-like domain-containing protein [Candidatus Saccharimonas sp.]|nr:Type 1 glutamine amidotransferase-like domain-containing protein [Candidatus Saccharimonas sp.]